ncbi:DNA alkylation repair protein [Pseudogracilibacillus sp. SE30717A]|uniref:DNA alkylation repair protein n=1 Tax=Pseudogracilibacillus sp. SE30717A TaxID=3098293 RepID=UPI00300E1301
MGKKQINELKEIFEQNRNEKNAIPMKKYMREQFLFIGLKSKERKELSKEFMKRLPFDKELESVIKTLWALPEREYQYVAIDYLIKYKKLLTSEHVELLEYLIKTKPWWDTVDAIATHLVGTLFQNHPHLINSRGNQWLHSDSIWLKRTMIICQLKYKEKTNEKLLFTIIKETKDIDQFFIQKAIGWALREYSKTNPTSVFRFINNEKLSNLARREGLKHIEIK